MKNSIAAFAFAISLLLVTSLQAKEDDAQQSLLKMKAGSCTFTLLDSNGVKPLSGSTLSVIDSKDGKPLVTIEADEDGKCHVKLVIGRYVLNVDKRNLAVIDATEDSKITQCRIVVPETDVLVGGQDDDQDLPGGADIPCLSPLYSGGVAILAGGIGGYLIYDNNKDKTPSGESP